MVPGKSLVLFQLSFFLMPVKVVRSHLKNVFNLIHHKNSSIRTYKSQINCKSLVETSASSLRLLITEEYQGRGCGVVGRAVAFETRDSQFESQLLSPNLPSTIQCIEKTKIERNDGLGWDSKRAIQKHFLNFCLIFLTMASSLGIA